MVYQTPEVSRKIFLEDRPENHMMIRTFFLFFFLFGSAMTGLWAWAMLGRQSAMGATSLSQSPSKSSLKLCLTLETTVYLLEVGESGLPL